MPKRRQRTRTPARWSLFDRTYWLTTFPGVPPLLRPWPDFLAGFLGATHALDLTRWLKNRGGRHWLGLHSHDSHRRSQLALPREAKRRRAILDEFTRRFAGNLRARPISSRSGNASHIRREAGRRRPCGPPSGSRRRR